MSETIYFGWAQSSYHLVYLQQPEFLHFSVSLGLLLAISAKDLEQWKLQVTYSCISKWKRICKQKDFHPSKFQFMQYWNIQFKMPIKCFGEFEIWSVPLWYWGSVSPFHWLYLYMEQQKRIKELFSQKVRYGYWEYEMVCFLWSSYCGFPISWSIWSFSSSNLHEW